MSDDEILERIKKVIENQLGIEPDDIKLESTFFEDLDAPPIKKPSISSISLNIFTLFPSTEPP